MRSSAEGWLCVINVEKKRPIERLPSGRDLTSESWLRDPRFVVPFLRLGVVSALLGSASLEVFRVARAKARFSWQRFISQPAFRRPCNPETVVL